MSSIPPYRPIPLPVDADAIPAALKALAHWVVWRYVEDVDRETGEVDWDKPPLNARGGSGSSTNPATWSDFDSALTAYRAGGLDGLGFVLSRGADEESGLVGMDLDHCRDPQTGDIAEWARTILAAIVTYTEISPSGEGLRLFLVGKLPKSGRKKGNFEVYETGRYVTVTGQRLQGRPLTIEPLQEPLERIHRRFFPPAEPTQTTAFGVGLPASTQDGDLVAVAMAAANGEKFRQLWEGNWSSYGSRSEADLALCSELAFWCGPSAESRIADLFAQSGLFRSKWERQDYRERTIRKAYSGRTEFYDPPGKPMGRLLIVGITPAAAFAPDDGQGITIQASKIRPKRVEWLWPGRIPLGKLTTFAGIGGLGKTFVLLDMAARVSRGLPWPDGRHDVAEVGKVLFLSGEDDPEDTLVPRLIEMGADLDRIRFLRMQVLDKFTMADLATLNQALAESGGDVRLVVMDPPSSFLGDHDEHKNAEVRSLLSPLKSWCIQHRVSTVLNTHLNKSSAKVEATARVMGSVAWVNAVRAAHLFSRDPDDYDKILFVPMKMNLGKPSAGWCYRILPSGLCARVQWIGPMETTADQAVNFGKPTSRSLVATEWLIERFREKQEWPSDELFRTGHQDGISRSAIFQAKDQLHLPRARKVTNPDGSSVWVWWVPANWEPLQSGQ